MPARRPARPAQLAAQTRLDHPPVEGIAQRHQISEVPVKRSQLPRRELDPGSPQRVCPHRGPDALLRASGRSPRYPTVPVPTGLRGSFRPLVGRVRGPDRLPAGLMLPVLENDAQGDG